MEHTKRISVAMATYNGEKYIEEQLLSICRQTRRPDEIVISDDGSKDATLEVVARVAASEDAKGIDFVVITDNPRHGCGGNFDWAILHTKGNYIFVCGQDDIWMPEKVECIVSVFEKYEDALCILHNAKVIDSFGMLSDQRFFNRANEELLLKNCPEGSTIKLTPDLLEYAVSQPIASGITIAVRRSLAELLTPFPTYAEDQWIEFNALLNNGCYFINQILTYYRKHDTNTSGSRTRGFKRFCRLLQGIKSLKNRTTLYLYLYEFGNGCLERLEQHNLKNDPAYRTAKRVYEIGEKKHDAYQKGGLAGAWMVSKLYRTDLRYRKCGFWAFFYDFLFVLVNA